MNRVRVLRSGPHAVNPHSIFSWSTPTPQGESQSSAKPILEWYEKAGRVPPMWGYSPWYSFHEDATKEGRIAKNPKTCKFMSGLPSVIFLAINVAVFLRAGYNFRFTLTLVHSTLGDWKISACSHLLCTPVLPLSIFNWSKCNSVTFYLSCVYNCDDQQ